MKLLSTIAAIAVALSSVVSGAAIPDPQCSICIGGWDPCVYPSLTPKPTTTPKPTATSTKTYPKVTITGIKHG
ncbi:hypothetical protein QBC44DRAFT_370640 [Cladorrhinum sp. PSN332]|nr:hypothetical protein QBC44DRAFT_370640 [Cladorrhinum sp. PSN332]